MRLCEIFPTYSDMRNRKNFGFNIRNTFFGNYNNENLIYQIPQTLLSKGKEFLELNYHLYIS